MKQSVLDNLKNLRGWRTPRKLVAFAVDDYANVRVDSREALERLNGAGLDLSSPFDHLDTVETRQDLEALFEVLDSVRDSQSRPAIFTAYAMSANPDFGRILENGEKYHYETVSDTFSRLSSEQAAAYDGVWALWQEGMAKGLIRPQFHGREHLNIDLFEHKLRQKSPDMMANLANKSLAGITADPAVPGVGFTHAFGLNDRSQLDRHREILRDGLELFEKVWGFRSITFTPPAQKLHPSLFAVAEEGGVVSIDKPLRCVRAMGDGTERREINRSGCQRGQDHVTVVRNVVFEPNKDMGFDPIERAMQQISAAFRWRKPAIVSSHRVNYCGHIDESNRQRGLNALGTLLQKITQRWPEVEFESVDQIVEQMDSRT